MFLNLITAALQQAQFDNKAFVLTLELNNRPVTIGFHAAAEYVQSYAYVIIAGVQTAFAEILDAIRFANTPATEYKPAPVVASRRNVVQQTANRPQMKTPKHIKNFYPFGKPGENLIEMGARVAAEQAAPTSVNEQAKSYVRGRKAAKAV